MIKHCRDEMQHIIRDSCTSPTPSDSDSIDEKMDLPSRDLYGVIDLWDATKEAVRDLGQTELEKMSYDGVHWGMEINLLKAQALLDQILSKREKKT